MKLIIYECENCKKTIEVYQSNSEERVEVCPNCEDKKIKAI